MISHEKAVLINSKINSKNSKLIYPPQNLVDLIWKDKPTKSLQKVYIQGIEFTGKDAPYKIAKIREWVKMQPPDKSYPNKVPTPADMPVATLITSLSCIGKLDPLKRNTPFLIDRDTLHIQPTPSTSAVPTYPTTHSSMLTCSFPLTAPSSLWKRRSFQMR